jgi:regulator of replication initiation timing
LKHSFKKQLLFQKLLSLKKNIRLDLFLLLALITLRVVDENRDLRAENAALKEKIKALEESNKKRPFFAQSEEKNERKVLGKILMFSYVPTYLPTYLPICRLVTVPTYLPTYVG